MNIIQAMGAMNRGLNLPQIQKIMNEFERESATMDMKEEMMSDAVDDVMDDDLEDEEEEGDKILKQVLDEIGVDLSQQVRTLTVAYISGSLITTVQLSDARTDIELGFLPRATARRFVLADPPPPMHRTALQHIRAQVDWHEGGVPRGHEPANIPPRLDASDKQLLIKRCI